MKLSFIALFALFSLPSYAAGDFYWLGSGYSSENNQFTGRCVLPASNKQLLKGGNSNATFSVDTNLSRERLITLLDMKVAGEAKFTEIAASVEGRFVLNVEKNNFNLSQVFSWKINGPSIGFVPLKMNDGYCGVSDSLRSMVASEDGSPLSTISMTSELPVAGVDLCKVPALTNPTINISRFKEGCGDSFVSQVRLGASLIVSVNFNFKSSSVATAFAGLGSLSLVDLFKGDADFHARYKNYKDSLTISISAIQIGGDVGKLSHIFGNKAEGDDRIHILNCAFNPKGLERCEKAMSAVVSYAKDEFSPSLKNMNYDERDPHGPAVIDYVLKSYKNGGFSDLLKVDSGFTDTTFLANKKDVVNKGLENISYRNTIGRLLNISTLTEFERKKITFEANKNEKNLQILTRLESVCFEGAKDQCNREYQEYINGSITVAKQELDKIDHQSNLDKYDAYMDLNPKNLIVTEDFINLCQLYPTAKDKRSIFNTVSRIALASGFYQDLMQKDASTNVVSINIDKCKSLYGILSNRKTLDLSSYECKRIIKEDAEIIKSKIIPDADAFCMNTAITDLRPLKGLNTLEFLYLEGNRINDITPLENLTGTLKGLYLNGNNASDVSVLKKLKKLTYMDLSNNKFYSRRMIAEAFIGRDVKIPIGLLRIDGNSYGEFNDDQETGYGDFKRFKDTYSQATDNAELSLIFNNENLKTHCSGTSAARCLTARVCPEELPTCSESEKVDIVYRAYPKQI